QRIRIVVVVGEIGGERTFDRLVVPEGPRKDLAQRAPPVTHQRPKLDERRGAFTRVAECRPPAAEHAEPGGDPFGIAEDCCYTGAGRRKSGEQGRAGCSETLRKPEGRPDRPTPDFVE